MTRLEPAAATLLVLLGCGLVLNHVAGDSATSDEPVHIAAAVEIARQGTGRWNIEHPPLAKALAGLALSGLPLSPAPSPFEDAAHPRLLLRFLFENLTPGETVLFRARLPFALLFAALLLAVRREARARFGTAAGLVALAFCALEPNLLAHAGVVHTDLLVTLCLVLSLRPLCELPLPERRGSLWWLGLAWGLALLSKYSAPLLILVTLPLLALEARGRGTLVARRLAASSGIALLVLLAGFALAYRHQSAADREALARDRLLVRGRSPAAFETAVAVGRVLPPAGNFLTGTLAIVLQSRVGAGPTYFLGRVREGGSPAYFPVALAVKTSLGLALAVLLGTLAPAGRRLALCVGAGLILFFALSAGSAYNIGVRHALFAFPLAALLASAASARAGLVCLLLALEAFETLSCHPHELSFFNALAGGPQGGRRLLVDSNLDWGQDLARLAAEAPRLSAAPLPAVVFGGDLARRHPTLRPVAPGDEDRPGALLAMGETPLAIGPELLAPKGNTRDAQRLADLRRALLTRGRRVDEIGASIGIWRIESAPPR